MTEALADPVRPRQSREEGIDEFKHVTSQGGSYFGYFLTGTALYLAVQGVMVGVLFEAGDGSETRTATWFVGVVASVVAITVTIAARRLVRTMKDQSTELATDLGWSDVYFPPIWGMSTLFLVIFWQIAAGWILVWVFLSRN